MGKNLLICDVQPAYADVCDDTLENIAVHLKRKKYDNYIVTWNSKDEHVTEDTQGELMLYYYDAGIKNNILERIKWLPKNYNFFRNWMDLGVDHEQIIHVVKYMLENNIFSSKDIQNWNRVYKGTRYTSDNHPIQDHIYLPSWDFGLLQQYDNYVLIGGHYLECLEEIRILLEVLGKKYEIDMNLVYI